MDKSTRSAPGNSGTSTSAQQKPLRGSVLVGVDGSPASLEAITMGHRIATALGHPLSAIHIWHRPGPGTRPKSWHPHDDAMTLLARSVRLAFEPQAAPDVELFVEQGTAAESLITLSDGAAMLVVGSRGHSRPAGLTIGSVSSACAARALCPVLVVHEPGPETTPHHSHSDMRSTLGAHS